MVLSAVVTVSGWLVVQTAADSFTTNAQAAAASAVPITATVTPSGAAAASTGGTWTARKVERGTYELSFPHEVDLDILRWDEPAGVTVEPLLDGAWRVRFGTDDGGGVDTGFSFVAAPIHP